MPRVTKASNNKEAKNVGNAEVSSSTSSSKTKVSPKKEMTPKKATTKTTKKETVKKPALKETTSKVKKSVKKDDNVSKKPTKKSVAKKTSTTKPVAKKVTNKTTKKASPKKTTTTRKKVATKKENLLEYYDLPYRYNQTVVKILAQTPNTLFVYWDISDVDRKKFVKEFGDNFFNDTVPILIVHNKTKNYTFEVEVNDFANSWYFKVSDTKCEYEIEFGRRKKAFTEISIPNNYVYITSSNVIESPNDKFLFEPNTKTVFFRNVKTNQEFTKDVATFSFMEKISRIYNIYDIYKEIYKEEDLIDAINNPTSSGSALSFYKN